MTDLWNFVDMSMLICSEDKSVGNGLRFRREGPVLFGGGDEGIVDEDDDDDDSLGGIGGGSLERVGDAADDRVGELDMVIDVSSEGHVEC